MRRSGSLLLLVLVLVLVPRVLVGQSIRGRVLDAGRQPLIGALVELRDLAGKSLQVVITSPSGAFQLAAPAPGRYRYRVAAIGFQQRPLTVIDVPADGIVLPDIVMTKTSLRLPDLVALGRGKFCGKSSIGDDLFGEVLGSAHSAFQIMATMLKTHQIAFQTATIVTNTLYGTYNNFEAADTAVQTLDHWPIQSIDPDTLRMVGFGRTLETASGTAREYFGPDERVLFTDWFLDSHCFTVDKPKKNGNTDSLVLRFAPVRKTKLVDVAGDMVLDAHDLALLQFEFRLTNLPNWMPDEAAGGYMQFAQLNSGVWIPKIWSIWGPRAGVGPGRTMSVSGLTEKYGWVARAYMGKDTIVVIAPDSLK